MWLSVEAVLGTQNPLGLVGGENHQQGEGFTAFGADMCTQPCQLGWEAADIQVSMRTDRLNENPFLRNLFPLIRPSILDISFLQVDQTDGDGSQQHVVDLASAWMADNADTVDSWIAEAEAAPAVAAVASLAAVCPSTIIIQHDWYPDHTHGVMFQLAGPDGEIDDSGYYNAEIEPGVTIQLRAGGPAVGYQPPSSLLYQDLSILLAMVSHDNSLGSSASAPVVGVVSPIFASPIGLMWPSDVYDFDELSDIGESDATVLMFGSSAFVTWLKGTGFVREEQIDGSFDGSPSRFIVEGDVVQQNFVTNEPYIYENVMEDWGGKPIDFMRAADFGWEAYPGVGSLSVRPEVLEAEADCLAVLVPMIQQAAVDFTNDMYPAMQTVVKIAPQMGSYMSTNPGLTDWAMDIMSETGFFRNGPDGAAGSFDLDRVTRFYDSFAPMLEASGREIGVDSSAMVTNEFIDTTISFEISN